MGLIGGSKGFDVFSAILGIPFLLVGNYIVWGRFFHDAWLKFSVGDVQVFADINDVDSVHRLLIELRYAGNDDRDKGKPILSFPG